MDGVKVALGNDGLGHTEDRKEWIVLVRMYVTKRVSRGHFCLALCSIRGPSVLWWQPPGEGRDAGT